MKHIITALAGLGILAACSTAAPTASGPSPEAAIVGAATTSPASPQPDPTLSPYQSREVAPNITFYDAQEQRHTLSEFKGKFTLLCFFANYCTYCQKEVPHIQAFQAAHPGQVNVVAIEATGAGEDVVSDFAKTFGVTIPLYHDASRVGAQAFVVTNYPNTFSLSPDLVVETAVLGNVTDVYYQNMLNAYGGTR